jgi:hypothetical protein
MNKILARVCVFYVSVVEHCKLLLVHGLNAFRHWFVLLEVLVFVCLGRCVCMGMLSLRL